MRKLYVGNLPYNCSEEDLIELFGQFGHVEHARIIRERDSNRSKGFAFVEMEDANSAKDAMDKLDGADFNGRPLRVSLAREKSEDAPRGGGRY
jgi:RNA recognition motif-containing protein